MKNDRLFSYAGRIFDQNTEEIKWQPGEKQIFANIRMNDEYVTKIEIPLYFFVFIEQLVDEGYGETQRICYSDRLENWLKQKIKKLFKLCNSEYMSIEINAELSSMVEGTRYTTEGKLCEITIKNEEIFPYRSSYCTQGQENSESPSESDTSSTTSSNSSTTSDTYSTTSSTFST